VSNRFFNPVEVPIIIDPPTPAAGFVRIYGRGTESYALFPDGTEKLLTGGVIVVGAGDRDISYEESVLITDAVFLSISRDDSLQYSDNVIFGPFTPAPAIIRASDTVNGVSLDVISNDTQAVSDAANVDLVVQTQDTTTIFDNLEISGRLPITGAAADSRLPGVIDAQNWAGAVTSNTNFTDPANAIDLNEATLSFLNAQQTALSGTVTTTGEITLSMAPYVVTPTPTINSAKLVWGWQTGASGLLQTGNSVDVDIQYSLDGGSTFITLQNVTATVNASVDVEAAITATYAELGQLRFKLTGSVTSGTSGTLDARQFFGIRFARCEFIATQTL
jgi:hypothetical protein